MTRKTAQDKYDAVFESGRSRSRAKSTQVEPAASPDDVCEFVESQVRQITNAVRLFATRAGVAPYPREQAEPDSVERPGELTGLHPLQPCEMCDGTDEPHLHGAKLFVAGKETF